MHLPQVDTNDPIRLTSMLSLVEEVEAVDDISQAVDTAGNCKWFRNM